jgi:hypothetical protein
MVEIAVERGAWSASTAAKWAGPQWKREFTRWLRPYLVALPRARQRHWAPAYVAGLLGPSARRSIQPMAALVSDGDYDQLHHFISTGAWDAAPLAEVLVRQATRALGGSDASLIIDDTTLLKKGTHSVGVSPQCSGAVGKLANCQTVVTLTLARGEVPLPVAMRLFLPACWAEDARRCARAGVPPEARVHREKWLLALEEIDRVQAAGAVFGCVLLDAGYGSAAEFRQALSARGLAWVVGSGPTCSSIRSTSGCRCEARVAGRADGHARSRNCDWCTRWPSRSCGIGSRGGWAPRAGSVPSSPRAACARAMARPRWKAGRGRANRSG